MFSRFQIFVFLTDLYVQYYGSWTYNYLCNQCLSPLMLWVRISIRARRTTVCDKVCQWLACGRWFSPGAPVSSINKTNRHVIAEILLKVALSTMKQTNKANYFVFCIFCALDLFVNCMAVVLYPLTLFLSILRPQIFRTRALFSISENNKSYSCIQ